MADVNISKYRASVVRDGSKPSSPGFVVSEGQDPVNPPGTNNFVPYSGATANVDLGEFGLETGFINLDTTPTGTPTTQGTIYWDADDETVDVILNGYTMKIGEDLFYPVKNQTGSTIAKGTAVRFAGTLGASGRLLIEPFIANGTVPSSLFMGVTAEEILNGEDGKVLYFGRVRGINTDAFNEGDILYASTTVAGGYQTAIPLPPNNIVQVAAVVTKSINQGTIFVRPTLGSNINTDEGVKITSVADKNLLQYQSGTSLWENKTLAQVLGGTSSQFVKGNGSLDSTSYQPLLTNPVTGTGTTNYLPKFTGASTIGNSQVFDNGSGVGIGTSSISARLEIGGDASPIIRITSTSGPYSQIQSNTVGTLQLMADEGNIGANTSMRFRVDGTEVMRLSGGNVLIGTTTDNGARLQVSGSGSFINSSTFQGVFSGWSTTGVNTASGAISLGNNAAYRGVISYAADGNTTFSLDNSYDSASAIMRFRMRTAGTAINALTILGSGNVGIGTDTPSQKLDVSTTSGENYIRVNSAANQDSGYRIAEGGTNKWLLYNVAASDAFAIYDNTSVAERLRITSSGNVGIGTTSPTQKLHVNNGASTGYVQITGQSKNVYIGVNSIGAAILSDGDAPLYFTTGTTTSERMRITSSGNVGIGTTSPSSKLDIRGTGTLLSTISSTSTDGASVFYAINDNNKSGELGVWGSTRNSFGAISANNGYVFANDNLAIGATLNIKFGTGASNTERMRITSSGQVQVGGTVQSFNARMVIHRDAYSIESRSTGTSSEGHVVFRNGNGAVGTIFTNGSSTSYNTSSDYRLKTDLKDYNGLDLVNKIKTYDFAWKTDNTRSFGVIAHELQDVINYAVTGQKDGIEMQGVDYSKLVPIMVKAIQELKQEIDTLKN